ncbi:MAG TPA: selenocysteine-specific translation elongation factor [Bryobacteraceae bacterium]|nr:selenocysteine-specific translation elongation factor [Bryobacteraceae bacterium]
MKYVVAGTAGHIDHGKTALVRALTGIDTDRLKEEKERGISIELGFAHLDLAPGIRLALVDVPGHERFIKNMLAGVGGIDFVMLVIAADESIKPQTREHFDICRMVGISRGLVVLTKSDLAEPETLDLVRLEVEDLTRNSFLSGAPVVAISSTTGFGMHELRQTLLSVAEQTPERSSNRYFRLPLDRVFSMRGFGTVVTGTISGGQISAGQEVEIYPIGKKTRVRGLQTHGDAVESARAGQRAAVNLAGVEAAELSRGMTLAGPGRFFATKVLDCVFELLPGAKPLKNRAPVHFHAGTAEVEAAIRFSTGVSSLEPGERAFARITLRDAVLLLPGDRFIVRMFSPVVTIGGGVVLDILPPRRFSTERLRALENGTAAQRIELLVSESGAGLSLESLVARTGLHESEILEAARPLVNRWFASPAWVASRRRSAEEILREFHRLHPLLPGMPKEDLRSRVLPDAPDFALDALDLVSEGDVVRLASHQVSLRRDEEEAAKKMEEIFRHAGLRIPSLSETLAQSGVEIARAKTLLQMLLKDGRLVRISAELVVHASALDALRVNLSQRAGMRFTVPDFKEWTGVSRKYAIPLLEFLDRQRITRREGDTRVIL